MAEIESGNFLPYFQPQVTTDGKTIGVEALARLQMKDGEIISPYFFMKQIKENGRMIDMTKIIFQETCKEVEKWQQKNSFFSCSVNIDPSFFENPRILLDIIREGIRGRNISPYTLHFEITENGCVNFEKAKTIMEYIRNVFKINFILDDIGIGTEDIRRANNLPVSKIKIDKSLTCKLEEYIRKRNSRKKIEFFTRNFQDIVFEGTESQADVDTVLRACKTLQIDNPFFQGFFFHKPSSANNIEKMIHQ